MERDCNADGCLRLCEVKVSKAWYCPQHARQQVHIRNNIRRYKLNRDLGNELRWRIKEQDFRCDGDEPHVKRIRYLENIVYRRRYHKASRYYR